jgi:hypothetical protein
MRKTLIGLVAGLAVMGVVATPSARAQTHFSFYFGAPPPVVVAPPYYDPYWQPGYYGWNGYNRYWVPGRWARPYGSWNGRWGWDDRWRGNRWDRARRDQGRWRGDNHHGNGRWAHNGGRHR